MIWSKEETLEREEIEAISSVEDYPFYARVRYTSPLVKCSLTPLPDGNLRVNFASAQRIARGQSAVIYRGKITVAGGFIEG